jgi:succinate dehydrogenase/fumarate reductase flavoprotein subunit
LTHEPQVAWASEHATIGSAVLVAWKVVTPLGKQIEVLKCPVENTLDALSLRETLPQSNPLTHCGRAFGRAVPRVDGGGISSRRRAAGADVALVDQEDTGTAQCCIPSCPATRGSAANDQDVCIGSACCFAHCPSHVRKHYDVYRDYRALGTNNLTGDGYLIAAEAGAVLSGMEFSAQYGISPAYSSVTKGVVYFWGTFSDEQGNVLTSPGDRQSVVASELIRGPVYAILDKASPRLQEGFRRGQPNIFVPFDRMGIDPFKERFPITLRHEGTVRGTGGLKIDERSTTTVPGLFAAGDAATRQGMSGASTGGGGPNSSWAMATGSWAGEDAASYVRSLGANWTTREVRSPTQREAPPSPHNGADLDSVITQTKQQILPLDGGYFRNQESLSKASDVLSGLWNDQAWRSSDRAKVREAEALIATSRWATESALLRKESRGLQRRTDFPDLNPLLARSIDSGGTNDIWASFQPQQQMSEAS